MSINRTEQELLELLKTDPRIIGKSQFENLLMQASSIPERYYDAWKNFIETVLESNIDIIDEINIDKILSAIEDCARKGKVEYLEVILGGILLSRFNDFNANKEYKEQFKNLLNELSQKNDKRALVAILDNKIKTLGKFDGFLEDAILGGELAKTLLDDNTLNLSPRLTKNLTVIFVEYEKQKKIKENKQRESEDFSKFKNFLDDENFKKIISAPEESKIFQELWVRVMGSKDPKIIYEYLVNHEHFLELIKTEVWSTLFKGLEDKYKLKKRTEASFNQASILKNISIYIEKNNPVSSKDEQEYITLLKKYLDRGHCGGFTYLYLVAKMEKKENIFFDKLRVISEWDGRSNLTPEEAQVFEELTGQLIVAQDVFLDGGYKKRGDKQSNPNIISKLLSPDLLIKHKSLNYIYDIDILKNNLFSLNDGSIVELAFFPEGGGPGHIVAIAKRNEKYYYYDSNHISGEIELSSVEKLSKKILESAKSSGFNPDLLEFRLAIYITNSDEIMNESKENLQKIVSDSQELVKSGSSIRSSDIKDMLSFFENMRPITIEDINQFEKLSKQILSTLDLEPKQKKDFSEHYMKVMTFTGNAKRVNEALLFVNNHEGLKPDRIGSIWRSYFNNVHRTAILDPYEERLAFNILFSITSTLVNKSNLTDKERADLTKELQDFLKNHPKAVYLKKELIKPFQEDSKKVKEIEEFFSLKGLGIDTMINFSHYGETKEKLWDSLDDKVNKISGDLLKTREKKPRRY